MWRNGCENLLETLTQQLLDGKINPPSGHSIGAVDPPAEHMDAKPDPPIMKKMVHVKVDGDVAGVQVPDATVKQWHNHPVHGAEFAAWMETFNEEFPKPEKKTSGKRGQAQGGPPQKQPKKATSVLPSLSSLLLDEEPNKTMIQRIHLLNLQQVDLVVQAGAVFLQNMGEQKVLGSEY